MDRANQPASFPKFPLLPWELRKMIWEFALPRSVFTSAILSARSCVPYPIIARVCHEAWVAVKESGSMVTAWNQDVLMRTIRLGEPITDGTGVYISTWYSSRLDTIFLNLNALRTLKNLGEAHRCDLVDICRSSTSRLVVPNNPSRWGSRLVNHIYQRYLKGRDKVFLSIRYFNLVLKKKAWDNDFASQLLEAAQDGTQIIHLDDTAALRKYPELWEHCCQAEMRRSWINRDCEFGTWLKMATDEEKRKSTRGWMRKYTAWIVERQAYEKRVVPPEVDFVLRIADHIISGHGQQPNPRRGHEIVNSMGNIKKDHPLVRKLDIKLPEVVPVGKVSIPWRCLCKEAHE